MLWIIHLTTQAARVPLGTAAERGENRQMAEIKSTIDLVMERLARMDLDDAPDMDEEEQAKEGMRLAAEFLREPGFDLAGALEGRRAERPFLRGLVDALLRNVVLPRDDQQQTNARRAMEGLLAIGGQAGDLAGACADLQNILQRYLDHRKQLRQQLEDAFAGQMAQLEMAVAQETGMHTRLDPSQHPKFQEEWQRLVGELDDQYGRAVDQYKDLIRERLAG